MPHIAWQPVRLRSGRCSHKLMVGSSLLGTENRWFKKKTLRSLFRTGGFSYASGFLHYTLIET